MLQAFTIALPLVLLLCGLSIDVGRLELIHQRMQSAADAGALSAELEAERGTGNWVTLGQQDASQNGFTNGVNGTSVTVTQFANYGEYNGRFDGLQVTISQPVRTIFMGTLNGGYVTATASSVALITPCVYLTGTGQLQNYTLINYTGSIDADSCPINVNTSMYIEQYGHVAVEAINVAGPSGSSNQTGYVWPTPMFNIPTVSDPLSTVSSPSFSGSCDHTSYSITSGNPTLSPGNYCKGLNISNASVTLNPGLYVITGGGTWNQSTITGSGVTLYFTSGGGAGYGQFIVQNATLNLSAADDSSNSATPAISIFADRSWTPTGSQDFQFISSSVAGDGIWYLPKAGIELWSCGTVTGTHYMGLVADNLFTAGSIYTPTNNYSSVTTGNPFRKLNPLVQ